MSKFLSIIEASVPGDKDTTTAVVSAIIKKPDSALSPAEKNVKSAFNNKLNKVAAVLNTQANKTKLNEAICISGFHTVENDVLEGDMKFFLDNQYVNYEYV